MKLKQIPLFIIFAFFLLNVSSQSTNAQGNPRPIELGQPAVVDSSGVPDDVHWDSRFTTQGLSGQVNAIAGSGSNVYVGGNFATADNVVVNRIAKWNGSSWSALGQGVGCGVSYCTPSVNAIAISGSNVYVGGMFTTAGGVSASSIAVWNGSSWSALGGGVDGSVYAIAVNGNDIYVGGYFTTAGGVNAHSIAKWNTLTNTWSGVGTNEGVYGGTYCSSCGGMISVSAIAVNGNDVYVGGYFGSAGLTDVYGIAKFDGVNWSSLGSGVSLNGNPSAAHISAIAVNGGIVYIGGLFNTAGGASANSIAVWDGATWSSLGTGIPFSCGSGSAVSAIAFNGGNVYVGGSLSVNGYGVAMWNGSSWNGVGGGISSDYTCSFLNALAFNGTDLYIGGVFTQAGGTQADNFARWSASSWFAIGTSADNAINSIGGSVQAIAISGNDVYIGGCFWHVGAIKASNIAKWNALTNTWSALGTGTSQCVYSIAISGSNVYAGGNFVTAGGNVANGIAKWNGTAWTSLGGGVSWNGCCGQVNAIALSGTDVYVGGSFNTAGSNAANNIAKWNGNTWTSLSDGVNGLVNAIAISGNNVYVGGSFDIAGGISAANIAIWNGSTWSVVGTSGVSPIYLSSVNTIATNGNDVFVGGGFSSAFAPIKTRAIRAPKSPKISASNLVRWNALSNSWYPLGSGVDNTVYAIVVNGNVLYAVGDFSAAGGTAAPHIAKWDGSTWSGLGSGLDDSAYTLALNGGMVYAGGNFSAAGNKPSVHFARWQNGINTIFLPLVVR